MQPYYEDEAVTIYHGDCRDVLPMVAGDVLMTDPDYGVGIDYTRLYGLSRREFANVGTAASLRPREADALVREMLSQAQLTRACAVLFWSGSWTRLDEGLRPAVLAAGWSIHHMGIWYKRNGAGPSGNGLARRFEPWFWLRRGEKAVREGEWNALPDCIDVMAVARGNPEACAHPTQKPVELIRQLMRFFSAPGATVLDPFMGSGTTLRAAKDLGRRAIGIEIQEAYCEIAARRMAQTVLAL